MITQLRKHQSSVHLSFCPFEFPQVCIDHLASILNVLTLSLLKIKVKQTCQCSLQTPCVSVYEGGESLNELPVELPEGEFGSVRPGDLTCQQMIAALFSMTPLFEKSSGFNRKCPRCFDTVAWIPSPPGLAYGHSMPLFMRDSRSAKTDFSFSSLFLASSFLLSASLYVSVAINVQTNNKIIQQRRTCEGRGNKLK